MYHQEFQTFSTKPKLFSVSKVRHLTCNKTLCKFSDRTLNEAPQLTDAMYAFNKLNRNLAKKEFRKISPESTTSLGHSNGAPNTSKVNGKTTLPRKSNSLGRTFGSAHLWASTAVLHESVIKFDVTQKKQAYDATAMKRLKLLQKL